MIKLKVSPQEAERILQQVKHERFRKASTRHWKIDTATEVTTSSICWLYCWGKTGMGSTNAASDAQTAFNTILDMPFEQFDMRVNHETARLARYDDADALAEINKVI